jgi:hypothetical protein
MVAVEVGRKQTRKVCNNVRGVTGLGCILSPPLYIKTHSRSGYQQLDAGAILKSRHAYRKLEMSVFLYGKRLG